MIFSPYGEYDGWSFFGPYTSAGDSGNRTSTTAADGTTKTYEPGLFDIYSLLGIPTDTATTAVPVTTESITPDTTVETSLGESAPVNYLMGGSDTGAAGDTGTLEATIPQVVAPAKVSNLTWWDRLTDAQKAWWGGEDFGNLLKEAEGENVTRSIHF